MFDPAGMRPFVEEWEMVAAGLLQRVYRECVGHTVDEKTAELRKSLEIYPGVKELSRIPKTQSQFCPSHSSKAASGRRIVADCHRWYAVMHHGAGVAD
jgi:hypothetical protein